MGLQASNIHYVEGLLYVVTFRITWSALLPVLYFPPRHGLIIKLKALQMNDQCMWQDLDTASLDSVNLHTPCLRSLDAPYNGMQELLCPNVLNAPELPKDTGMQYQSSLQPLSSLLRLYQSRSS